MRAYAVTLAWRGYRWRLKAIAAHPVDLITPLVGYFGPGLRISVRPA